MKPAGSLVPWVTRGPLTTYFPGAVSPRVLERGETQPHDRVLAKLRPDEPEVSGRLALILLTEAELVRSRPRQGPSEPAIRIREWVDHLSPPASAGTGRGRADGGQRGGAGAGHTRAVGPGDRPAKRPRELLRLGNAPSASDDVPPDFVGIRLARSAAGRASRRQA